MFRHRGKNRTYTHNLRLAALLSFTAGMVNICGVLSVKVLTTNVTGHFAFFAEELVNENYLLAIFFLLYIFCFLFGSFSSNFLIELMSRKNLRNTHTLPMIIEILILLSVGIGGNHIVNGQIIAGLLLFAMGLQNALVTQVSQSIVRTTHLTGLFTDLGIELSQLFFYREDEEKQKLSKSIYLRLAIILFFFLGCVFGGFLFKVFAYKTLLFTAITLLIAMYYDNFKTRYYLFKRKIRNS